MANDRTSILDQLQATDLFSVTIDLWEQHPILESISLKLANYTGPLALTADNRPLTATAIRDATAMYLQRISQSEELAAMGYIRTLLVQGIELYSQNLTVETPSGTIRWIPVELTWTEFLARYPDQPITVTHRPPRYQRTIAMAFLMTKIIPASALETNGASTFFSSFIEEVQ